MGRRIKVYAMVDIQYLVVHWIMFKNDNVVTTAVIKMIKTDPMTKNTLIFLSTFLLSTVSALRNIHTNA